MRSIAYHVKNCLIIDDSLVDVSARKECYEAIFSFCTFLANESLSPELLMDDLSAGRSDDSSSAAKGASSANNNEKNESDARFILTIKFTIT